MMHDKKTINGKVHFVLLHGVGEAFISADVDSDAVLKTLAGLGAKQTLSA